MTIHRRYLKSTPPPGHKRVRDWEGQRVRTVAALTNGRGTVPVGSFATVVNAGGGSGLTLQVDGGFYITKVPTGSVELTTDAKDWTA